MVLYAYQMAYKVTTNDTPFELVYGLHPMMPIEYLLPTSTFETNHDFSPTWILTDKFSKAEKLGEVQLTTTETAHMRQLHHFAWAK